MMKLSLESWWGNRSRYKVDVGQKIRTSAHRATDASTLDVTVLKLGQSHGGEPLDPELPAHQRPHRRRKWLTYSCGQTPTLSQPCF